MRNKFLIVLLMASILFHEIQLYLYLRLIKQKSTVVENECGQPAYLEIVNRLYIKDGSALALHSFQWPAEGISNDLGKHFSERFAVSVTGFLLDTAFSKL